MILLLLVNLVGCDFFSSQPAADADPAPRDRDRSSASAPADDAEPRTQARLVQPGDVMPVQTQRSILPGRVSGPQPPEAVLTRAQCNEAGDGGPLMQGSDCLTAVIECDQTVVGHTVGGINRYNTRFYERNHCTPATSNHDLGNERVYRLDIPGRLQARVTLDTPCADLSLAAMQFDGDCPSANDSVRRCEMDRRTRPGTGRDSRDRKTVDLFNTQATRWYLVVEGADDQDGPFAIHVQCAEW